MIVWLGVFLVWAFSIGEVRKASVEIVKMVLAWKIVFCVSMMAAYVAMVILALRTVGLWNMGSLKATVLWTLTVAVAMVFEVRLITDDERYFQKAVRDGFKVSVVLEFIINLYVLSFPLELLLIPTTIIPACMLVLAESKDEFKSMRAPLNSILALIGLGLLAYAAHRVYADFQSFAQLSTLTEFLLPILLTIVFLPFLYTLATVVSYENLFVRLRFLMNDPELRRFTMVQLLRKFGLDFRNLNLWAKRFGHDRPRTRKEVLTSIRESEAKYERL